MAQPAFKFEVFGIPEFVKGIEQSKKLSVRFMRGAFKRGGNKLIKTFKQQQLSGPPGIVGGQLKKGKSTFASVYGGNEPKNIGVKVGISRLLHIHELGATIHAKGGGKLFIIKRSTGQRQRFTKGSKEQGEILAVVDRVVIPKRLHFKELAKSMAPEIQKKAADEAARGTEVAMEESMKGTLSRLVRG